MSGDEKDKQLAAYSGAAKVIAAPGRSEYPRFDRGNFGIWQTLMECALRANELWDAVDPGGDAFKKERAWRKPYGGLGCPSVLARGPSAISANCHRDRAMHRSRDSHRGWSRW